VSVPFSLVVIKPLSVGRGEAPDILNNILMHCPVSLRMFREWTLCRTTLEVLMQGPHAPVFLLDNRSPCWVCLFTHNDRVSNPTPLIAEYVGSTDPWEVQPNTLRHQYGGFTRFGITAHPSDNVVHLADDNRAELEALLLFTQFNVLDV
jgi:nucleoside diphosphate kinase